MPVTVSVQRGNPLPPGIALLFTIVGLGLIIAGFTVIPEIEEFGSGSDIILIVIAAILVIPAWVLFLVFLVRSFVRRVADGDAVTAGVPRELPEPPGTLDPSTVAVLLGEGRPSRRAVAGTLLALAHDDKVEIEEYGPKVVVDVARGATGANPSECLVIAGLHEIADDEGTIEGPPVWKNEIGWWRAFAREARKAAMSAALVDTRIPFIGLMLVFVFTAVGFSLVFFSRTAVFVGAILFANGIPHLLARASGYRLTDVGRRARAEWMAFGRYLHAQGSVKDVGPAAIAVWGPNLSYGVVLGQAPRAAAALTPPGDDDDGAIDDEIAGYATKTYEL